MNSVAEQTSPATRFDCRPRAVEHWIASLPRASVGRTAELVFHALQNIQSQELRADNRFEVLETLRDTVHYVTGNMRKRVSGQAYPMPDKIVLIASACQSIYDLMSHGYRTIFHEMQKQNSLFVDKKQLATAIQRAITYIHRSLLLTYETYSAYHHNYWEQLHELYEYAELHKLSKLVIHDTQLRILKKSSIENEYLRANLLFLSEPYHLAAGEIVTIDNQIENWYALAQIRHFKSATELADNSTPVIELDRDQPPLISGNIEITSDIKRCRIVRLDGLLHELKTMRDGIIARQKKSGVHKKENTISLSLLRRLIESWSQSRRRRFPRQQVFEKINVTLGLHQTHLQLMYESHVNSQRQKPDNGFVNKARFESIDIKDVSHARHDVWELVYAWAQDNNSNVNGTDPAEPQDILDYRVKQDNWTLLNESAEGFCLMCVDRHKSKIQVGELVSIQRNNQTGRSIGIIRWMKAYGQTGVELGGMLLAPSATAVSIFSSDNDGSDRVVGRGILLPLMPQLNRPETLVTFTRQYKTGQILQLGQPDSEPVTIKLIKLLAENRNVCQYHFVRMNNRYIVDESDESSAEIDLKHFQDVWNTI